MTFIAPSPEWQALHAQARDLAAEVEQPLSTSHFLLALLTVPNRAEAVLLAHGLDEDRLADAVEDLGLHKLKQPDLTLTEISQAAQTAARVLGQNQVDGLHLLIALTRLSDAYAYRLLETAQLDVERLRAAAQRAAGQPTELIEVEDTNRDTVECPALPRRMTDTSIDLPAVGAGTRTAAARGRNDFPPQERRRTQGRRQTDLLERETPRDFQDRDLSSRVVEALPASDPMSLPSPFVLNKERFKWLTTLGRNLSHLAYLGQLDPVFGRDREVELALDILNKRRSNNPCLIGEPGVGKTAVAEGLADRMVRDFDPSRGPPERVLIQIDVGAILAGTHLRGSLAERLKGLQEEVRKAAGRVVVFIDELHTLVGAGGGEGGHDAAQELKAALARGEFPCVGATTIDEYREFIECDPALERRFAPVHIEEPDEASTRLILEGLASRYAAHHGVAYLPEGLDAAVKLGRRFVHDRRDPDKSLSILDLAGAIARRSGGQVDRLAVAEVVSRLSRVPKEHLVIDDPQRILEMEAHLAEAIVGQRHVLETVAKTIRRSFAGFGGKRPIGSLLFLGPTGVGKTEVVKVVAEFLFGSRDALLRFDMSEYLESHSVARLIGSPPGYVGHNEGGQLTDAVRRRPYQVLLFDEIEKAHRDVWNLLLQILDEGQLTDSRGRRVDFSNTVVVLTSNLGSNELVPASRKIGFFGNEDPEDKRKRSERAFNVAKDAFPPELWNRLESKLVFHPLSKDEIRQVARLILAERTALLARERDIAFRVSDEAVEHLLMTGGFDPLYGARPMRQTIARELESPLAERILAGELKAGDRVLVELKEGKLTFQRLARA